MEQEHKLIQGGEIWLPYARSCIKRLRATGLSYSSQKFDMGDGSIVKVRIEPGHSYIDISGGGCAMEMDSGIINVRTKFPNNPLIYSAGKYVDSERTTNYNINFSKLSADGKVRTNPNKTGQISGDIKGSGKQWKGEIPVQTQPPKSFAPKKTIDADGVITEETMDESLAGKNVTVTKVPASNFTGRMRLYVQAMYGQTLYKGMDGPGEKKAEESTGAAWWGYDLPGLFISPGDKPVEGLPQVPAQVNASAGVFLDKNGRHWLFTVGNEEMYVMPLIGNKCAEASRELIKPDSHVLNDVDKDHLEAYILSSCRPLTRKVVSVPLGGSYNSVQMGFGWHWNWSGTCADIVENVEYFQGTYNQGYSARPNFAIESTHRRLSLTQTINDETGESTWSASVATLETARWTSSRNLWGVCYPVQGAARVAGKVVPRWTEKFACDAPFYVFYKKDIVQVCRIKANKNKKRSIRKNSYGCRPGIPLLVEGDRSGFYDWTDDDDDWFDATFSVGSDSYELPIIRTSRGYIGDATVSGGTGPTGYPYGGAYVFNVDQDIQIGYPSAYETFHLVAGVVGQGGFYTQIVTSTTSSIEIFDGGMSCAVVPFDDAEAIYIWSRLTTTTVKDSRNVLVVKSGSCGTYTLTFGPGGGISGGYLTYVYGPGSINNTVLSSDNPDATTEIKNTTTQVLHCARGVVPIENFEGSMNDYMVPQYDEATPVFEVVSSAMPGPDATVFNPFCAPVGASPFYVYSPIIVGWS